MHIAGTSNDAQSGLITALTIAGSDSGGGAGIQADLKTFFALGVHGTSAITAITAQNTLGVQNWQAISTEMIVQQLDAVLNDLPPRAVKTGMLPGADAIAAVAATLQSLTVPLIVDPVLVASSGDSLTETGSVQAYREQLLPLATLVTPNIPEAEALTGIKIETTRQMHSAAAEILGSGCTAVLIKGGHGTGTGVEDFLYTRSGTTCHRHARRPGVFHGTGCTLSAAITAYLATGRSLEDAVTLAIEFVGRAIEAAIRAGAGTLHVLRPPGPAVDPA